MAEKNGHFNIVLDPSTGIPVYRQIILQIEMALADGRLSTGYQLPTVRGLAVDLRVNPNTVARAYNELEIRGMVSTQFGAGTFVSGKEITIPEKERHQILTQLVHGFVSQASSYGFTVNDIIKYLKDHQQEEES